MQVKAAVGTAVTVAAGSEAGRRAIDAPAQQDNAVLHISQHALVASTCM